MQAQKHERNKAIVKKINAIVEKIDDEFGSEFFEYTSDGDIGVFTKKLEKEIDGRVNLRQKELKDLFCDLNA